MGKSHPQFALTFDDGPHPVDTLQLLEVLDKHQVKATFFWLGENLEKNAALVQAAARAGHQVALHGWTHRPFPLLGTRQLQKDLERTRDLLTDITGIQAADLRDVRPPYGAVVPATLRSLKEWDYRTVLVSSIPLHWVQSIKATVKQVMQHAQGGMILDLHEGQPMGPRIAKITDALLPELKAREFDFVTVDEMWREQDASVGIARV
ncbi:chitooligosaccharide deacetylase NodB-like protein [Deinococcus cellulosilyticus NBRC 106333 = KACC 11606]|uniref:Chitooligosaccharide deacetylase NodB-like protein n=2 Tax=Deinococcus cellulosilyticus TaxID=401558 RepID=A0A511N044_DEIC1|nr:chitooligosaccharide deacetylase NodB-like protein [Deinococcus cellulosilyticus NBRC 106333 = KACC 11606]